MGYSGGFRGRGAMMAQMATAQKGASAPGAAAGAGAAAPGATGTAQGAHEGGEPAAPVGAMARMGISQQDRPPRQEQTRRPTVSRRGVPGKTGGHP